MNTIKISFEITYNWNIKGFRNLIKLLLSDEEKYEVFIISNNDSSASIYKAADILSLDSNHVIVCNFNDDKLQAIRDNNIDIHMDSLKNFADLVDTETDAYGVFVDNIWNNYYSTSQYIVNLDTAIENVKNDQETE